VARGSPGATCRFSVTRSAGGRPVSAFGDPDATALPRRLLPPVAAEHLHWKAPCRHARRCLGPARELAA
jgi:hypothetical protein